MGRFREPTKDEIRDRRRALADKAQAGLLVLPGAVREMRQAIGLSQDDFAQMLRLTRRQVAEIERGDSNPTFDTLERIGRVFGFGLGFVPVEGASLKSRKGAMRDRARKREKAKAERRPPPAP